MEMDMPTAVGGHSHGAEVKVSRSMSILIEVRMVLIEVVTSALWVFITIGAQISVESCLPACKAPGSEASTVMPGSGSGGVCHPPTSTIQVSLASGFAAAVTTGIAFLPSRPATWQRQSLQVTEANSGGGHFNPIVSLAVGLRGFMKPIQLVAYLVAQAAGAVIGAFLWRAILDFECYKEVFTMQKPLVQGVGSKILLFALLGLGLALVHLWAHQRLLSMATPVLVGFAYIASTLVGFPLLAGDGPNPLRTVGLVAVGVFPAHLLSSVLSGAVFAALAAVGLDLLLFGRTLWEGRPKKSIPAEDPSSDDSSGLNSE